MPAPQPRGVWRVELDGHRYYETDLSFADVHDICAHVGRPNAWAAVHPGAGPENAVAVFAAFLRKAKPDLSFDDAVAEIRSRSIDLVRSFQLVDDDDLPLTFTDGFPDPPKGAQTMGG